VVSKWRLGGAFVAAMVVMAVLAALGQLLAVPGGYGVEDFLGWSDSGEPGTPSATMRDLWDRQLGVFAPWVEGLYLGLDTALFMPLYGLVFIGLWRQLQRDFAAHSGKDEDWSVWLVRLGTVLLSLLWAVDLAENLSGLARMQLRWVGFAALAGAGVMVWWLSRACDGEWLRDLRRAAGLAGPRRLTLSLLAVFVIALVVAFSRGGSRVHGWKQGLILPLVLGPLLLALWVQYGPHAKQAQWPRVVAVRAALVGLLWRTRYVLAALAACAALMLVMNQGLDVIYATAAHPWPEGGGAIDGAALAATLLTLGLTGLALWVFGYSCWLWSRLVLRVAPRGQGLPAGNARTEDHLAMLWARLLGIAPALLVLGMVLAVLPHAVVLDNKGPIVVLLAFALAVVAGSVGFIWQRDRQATKLPSPNAYYYSSATLRTVLGWAGGSRLFGFIPTAWLPAAALLLALACRTLGQGFAPSLPTLTLPIVLCLVAFWLGMAGWISLFEESERVPWFLIVLIVMGLLGSLGLAENHRVPLGPVGAVLAPWAALGHSWALGLVLMAVSVLVAYQLLRRPTSAFWLVFYGLLLAGGGLGVMHHADSTLPPQAASGSAGQVEKAPDALAAWLRQLCDGECPEGEAVPVYIVAAEGGGIRSAYWTALVLERLGSAAAAKGIDFERRSFAMTGVSGGAMGLAVYRACRLEQLAKGTSLRDCIQRFGSADLLAPLVGAWFFEDAVARLLPQILCSQPGCGFMSRGLWFERAMAAAVPQLTTGLVDSRQNLIAASGLKHQPYLLLNSTWVESGERTVASELIVDREWFPGARDQLAILGSDIALTTASHNSARFPFSNALGAVHTPSQLCQSDAYLQRAAPAAADTAMPCGHLADGGYFDNSGGHSGADLLRLLHSCLHDTDAADNTPCPGLSPDERARLARVVKPHVILVRNGVGLGPLPVPACATQDDKPDLVKLGGEPQPQMPLGLRQPQCADNQQLFIDALGPIWAAIGTTGIGANGRLAAARPGLPGAAVVGLADLRENGPLYPLGWHLSPAARAKMTQQAEELDTGALLMGVAEQR
jgi:hypothetical protein